MRNVRFQTVTVLVAGLGPRRLAEIETREFDRLTGGARRARHLVFVPLPALWFVVE